MNKKNLFISVALTSFLLILLTGVVAASKLGPSGLISGQSSNIVGQASALQSTDNSSNLAIQNSSTTLSPQDAAQFAASFLGQTDVYSVEDSSLKGVAVYKVVFSSGYVVYVGLDGQPLGIGAPQFNSQNSFGFGGSSENEEHEAYEEHNDD